MDKKIIVAGYIGLEGSLKIAKEKEEELEQHFSKYFMNQIKECEKYLVSSSALERMELGQNINFKEIKPLKKENVKKAKGEENVMIPLGDLGKELSYLSLWSALWNLCESWKMGVEVEFSRIPIRQETIEICQLVGLNPYQISSRGSYLIFTSQAENMIEDLEKKEIPANIIGKTTNKRERLIKRGDYVRHLPRPMIPEEFE